MPDLLRLPSWDEEGALHVVVETPRGARAKLKFDAQLGVFVLSKSLLAGLTYPYDWGFVPSTREADGDPLDVMVIHDAATMPGLVVRCRPIGVLETEQRETRKRLRNDRVIATPLLAHRDRELRHVRQLGRATREELEKFFVASVQLEDKTLRFLGWKGPRRAVALVERSRRRFGDGG